MKDNTLIVLYLWVLFHCTQRHTVESQLVTAGTYYHEIKTSGKTKVMPGDNAPVLTEEMFQCSRTASCGTLGKRNNNTAFEELGSGDDRSVYDEILEKTKSGFKDCRELYKWGINESGVVDISWNNGSSFQAYCDMETDGGGWLVFQRRIDLTSFYRNWTDYTRGFGDKGGSFWLGLEALHWMTSNLAENVVLRIDLTDDTGSKGYAKYRKFVVGNASEKYKLSYGSYHGGNIGDGLIRSQNTAFSTPDKDSDSVAENCARMFRGAWWHNDCFDANLNNEHPQGTVNVSTPEAEGASRMSWFMWKKKWGTIIESKMMLKVVDN